jgi:Signal peptidase (SPase) II
MASRSQAYRLATCGLTGLAVLGVDAMTKASSHPLILHHYRQLTVIEFVAIGLFLVFLSLYRSALLALASGFFLGTLLGNGGELLVHGYATDWIELDLGLDNHIWLTNLADISAAVGMLCLMADFALAWRYRKSRHAEQSPRVLNGMTMFCGALATVAGLVSHNLDVGLLIFIIALFEGNAISWLIKRRSPPPDNPPAISGQAVAVPVEESSSAS